MKLILFALLTIAPLGWLVKDMPTEYEMATEMSVPLHTNVTWVPTTSSTSTTVPSRTVATVEVRPTTTSTPETSVADGAKCSEWWATASSMGWPDELLPILDEVMWRESRCTPDATNGADHGLVQVNWSTWRPLVERFGYTKADLYVPAVNLFIGRLIYNAAVVSGYRCPWSPWASSGNYCS